MENKLKQFRINVGFIVHENVGYEREYEIALDEIYFPPDLDVKNLKANILFQRTQQGLLCEVSIKCITKAECVRCLDEFDYQVDTDFTELFAFHEKSATEEMLLIPETGVIDLAPLFRDYILLGVAINPICKEDCYGLNLETGEKRNSPYEANMENPINPKMQVLAQLLKNKENNEENN